MSLLGAIGGVALLRLIGFVSTVFGANMPWMLSLQYVAMAAAFGSGLFVIQRGIIIEPPAFIDRIAAAVANQFNKRLAGA